MFQNVKFIQKELISLVGGGGKTTLMCRLASYFSPNLSLLTTTTKIEDPNLKGKACYLGDLAGLDLSSHRIDSAPLYAAKRIESTKAIGYSAKEIDDYYDYCGAVNLIVEADGSKGYPFKLHETHEPVVPQKTTSLLVVVGAEIFLSGFCTKDIFRYEQLKTRWGFTGNENRSLDFFCRILQDKRGYLKGCPPKEHCTRTLLINKSELLSREEIENLASVLSEKIDEYDRICFGSARAGTMVRSVDLVTKR